MPQYWLMKSEPDECSIDDLAGAPDRRVPWTGVRNYQARNFMRDDDAASATACCSITRRAPSPGIAGLAEVCSAAYPDATQFDPQEPVLRRQVQAAMRRAGCTSTCKLCSKTRLLALREMRDAPELASMVGAAHAATGCRSRRCSATSGAQCWRCCRQ